MNNALIITGASSGIGRELALIAIRDFRRFVLVARQKKALDEVAIEIKKKSDAEVLVVVADLNDPAAPEKIVAATHKQGWKVSGLINNAGFGGFGSFVETDWDMESNMIKTNIMAVTHLTKLCLPDLLETKHGRILNVASVAAFFPGPFMSVYYATKAFVLSWSTALGEELRGKGVTVTALCPGPTETGFAKVAGVTGSKLFSNPNLTAHQVAQSGYEAMMSGKTVVIPSFQNRIVIALSSLVPSFLLARVVRRLQDRG